MIKVASLQFQQYEGAARILTEYMQYQLRMVLNDLPEDRERNRRAVIIKEHPSFSDLLLLLDRSYLLPSCDFGLDSSLY